MLAVPTPGSCALTPAGRGAIGLQRGTLPRDWRPGRALL